MVNQVESESNPEESPRALAERYGLPFVDLEDHVPDPDLVNRFPEAVLFRETMLPIGESGRQVVLAVADPLRLDAIHDLTVVTRYPIDVVVAEPDQIRRHLNNTLGVGGGTVRDLVAMSDDDVEALQAAAGDELDDVSQASSVMKLVNEVIAEAVTMQASDIHIEPEEDDLIIRYRVDGLLCQQATPPELRRFRAAIVSRLKIMAKLNIAERRLPQDGRIRLVTRGREVDIRLSVIPMLHGEGVVMRLLDQSRAMLDLDAIDFPEGIRQAWDRLIRRPHGLILVTGPTGSGKTTTLYSSLCAVRDPRLKIVTVEDPVEYDLRQISQIQVRDKIGLSFAAGLRSILRHDPDVVLIGEIRDGETATSAVQASLTGHLVFSTLHTNDAPGAFARLVDMGIEPYLVSSTVEAVLAQRLLRRICPHCRAPRKHSPDEIPRDIILPPDTTLYEAEGCRQCRRTGYLGRIAIFELLTSTAEIRGLCMERSAASDIRQAAVNAGMVTLRQSAVQRMLAGETTLDEVNRVCPAEDGE